MNCGESKRENATQKTRIRVTETRRYRQFFFSWSFYLWRINWRIDYVGIET